MNQLGKNVFNLYVRLIYGLALVDFLTVIQLVSAPQFQIEWGDISASRSARQGVIGMMILCANVPLSFGWAMYADYRGQTGRPIMPRPYLLSLWGGMGIGGIGLVLGSFRTSFGLAFLYGALGASVVITLAMAVRMWIDKKSN